MLQIKDVPLHEVPVVEPEAALDEVIDLMKADPLHSVALVNEGQFLGLFNQEALDADLIPRGVDYALLSVGPYVHPLRFIAHPDESVQGVVEAMRRHGMATAPVVANRIFRGMVIRAELEALPGA